MNVAHKLNIATYFERMVFISVKLILQFGVLWNVQAVCVATNGALRFSCVVPFGAAHFFIHHKLKGEEK